MNESLSQIMFHVFQKDAAGIEVFEYLTSRFYDKSVFKANDPSNQPIFLKPIIDWSIECLYRHSPQKIHEYAVKHLDYDVKFKKLLCLME